MRWKGRTTSSNVRDNRGRGGTGLRVGGGLGVGGIVIVLALALLTGNDPLQMLSMLAGDGAAPTSAPRPADGSPDRDLEFVGVVLGDTEQVWGELFQQQGARYQEPQLELYTASVRSACGSATAAVGPFYCPADHTVYLDTSFFDDMRRQLGGGGDFAEAYVIAHEVAHHVQTLTGTTARVDAARRAGQRVEGADGLLVRQELQADCYAGVWAHHAEARNRWMDPGDIERALATASAIGDDRLQRRSTGTVNPDSFGHGTSEQRVRWFRTGFDTGDPARCDTFAARAL
ncbi:neutral zinc metallopeptidase [Coralloluteibacterium thermophilus]|uniref:Neutral zinc metallopeptidase n=1 Tax=Coralloluteibacterium thermophilum TaxID=2707049 RepID=A0ABV9NIA1_9GAMM